MITGAYTNADGGLHPAAVAMAVKLEVDLVKKATNAKVNVFHDLATATAVVKPGQQPIRPLTSKMFTLQGSAFTTDPEAIDVFLVSQPGFTGWTEVPTPQSKAP